MDSRDRPRDRPALRMTPRLDQLPRTPESHFRLHFYEAILHLRDQLPAPSEDNGLAFLRGYYEPLEAIGFGAGQADVGRRWRALLGGWETDASGHLPLRALRETCALSPL